MMFYTANTAPNQSKHSKFQGLDVLFYASDNHDAIVIAPLMIQDWGDYYGKLTDKFGVQWMFNCTSNPLSECLITFSEKDS